MILSGPELTAGPKTVLKHLCEALVVLKHQLSASQLDNVSVELAVQSTHPTALVFDRRKVRLVGSIRVLSHIPTPSQCTIAKYVLDFPQIHHSFVNSPACSFPQCTNIRGNPGSGSATVFLRSELEILSTSLTRCIG